jgi:hypothetical protein
MWCIRAVTADASAYHVECAAKVYGEQAIDKLTDPNTPAEEIPTDHEGNEIHVIFDWDECDDMSCDVCLERI